MQTMDKSERGCLNDDSQLYRGVCEGEDYRVPAGEIDELQSTLQCQRYYDQTAECQTGRDSNLPTDD